MVLILLSSILIFSMYGISSSDFQFTNDEPQKLYSEDSVAGDKNDVNHLKDYALLHKIKNDFYSTRQKNSDTTGWLHMPNVGYYPIMSNREQNDGNNFYLSHGPDKQYLKRGSLFLSCLSKNTFSDTALIYGHHMASGRMFGSLKKYKDSLFFKQNKSIIIYDGTIFRVYKPFSVYLIDDNGKNAPRQGDWGGEDKRDKYVLSLKNRSLVKSDFHPKIDGDIAYFWTCDYDFTNARLIVAASVIQTIPNTFSKEISITNINS